MQEGDENPFMQPRGGGPGGAHGGGGGMPGLGGPDDMDGMDDDPGLMLAIQAGMGQGGGGDRVRALAQGMPGFQEALDRFHGMDPAALAGIQAQVVEMEAAAGPGATPGRFSTT